VPTAKVARILWRNSISPIADERTTAYRDFSGFGVNQDLRSFLRGNTAKEPFEPIPSAER
jgi:hypothetical protein